jgi:hypothetical protein
VYKKKEKKKSSEREKILSRKGIIKGEMVKASKKRQTNY